MDLIKMKNPKIGIDWLRLTMKPNLHLHCPAQAHNFAVGDTLFTSLGRGSASGYQSTAYSLFNNSQVNLTWTDGSANAILDFSGSCLATPYKEIIDVKRFIRGCFPKLRLQDFSISRLDLYCNWGSGVDLERLHARAPRSRKIQRWKTNGVLNAITIGKGGKQSMSCTIYHKFMQPPTDRWKAELKFGSAGFTRLEYRIGRKILKDFGIDTLEHLAHEYTYNRFVRLWQLCLQRKGFSYDQIYDNDYHKSNKDKPKDEYYQYLLGWTDNADHPTFPVPKEDYPLLNLYKQGIGCLYNVYKKLIGLKNDIDSFEVDEIIRRTEPELGYCFNNIKRFFEKRIRKEKTDRSDLGNGSPRRNAN